MTDLDLQPHHHVHMVGIGGAGMSGLARILVHRGHRVTGSDLRESRNTGELQALGVTVTVGHDAAAVGDADVVVVSAAVGDDNEEVRHARDRGITVRSRAELLAALMADHQRVLVAGTHGKTTTTSMVVVAMQAAGLDPGFSIGAQLNEAGTNAHDGTDGVFVAEADESDRSVLAYHADVAVVTNAELDHPDAYTSDDEVVAIFARFLGQRRPGGTAVLCSDDPGSAALATQATGPVVTYGTDHAATLQLVPTGPASGDVLVDGDVVAPLHLSVLGHHNLLNATSALAVCHVLDVDLGVAAAGLADFTGVARRFQVVGEVAGVTVVDDYAHHPTELRATLQAARQSTDARILAVVQPHRYSRTKALGPELGRAAAAADLVWVTEIYGSGEDPEPGVSGRQVAEAAESAGARVVFQPHFAELVSALASEVADGDVVVVTGAGDISQVARSLVRTLQGDVDDG